MKKKDGFSELKDAIEVDEIVQKSGPPPLSTGSTMLNLACSDMPDGGLEAGHYYILIGDASAGKTFLAITTLAEACMNKHYKNYRLIYDNVEDGCLFDLERLFNKNVRERIEPPLVDQGGCPVYSRTVEEFYYNLDDALSGDSPCVYILDSMDSLTSSAEEEKFDETKAATRAGRQVKGSYQMDKAKINSSGLRTIISRLTQSGSILIILAQIRDNVGFGFEKKTRSGGHSLKFYATIEMWLSHMKDITKVVRDKKRTIGVKTKIKLKKNRITGMKHEVLIDIYPSFGIDDLGSCIDYLVDEGWWPTKKNTIEAKNLKLSSTRAKLIKEIEKRGWEKKVSAEAGKCWLAIKKASDVGRKNRYAIE